MSQEPTDGWSTLTSAVVSGTVCTRKSFKRQLALSYPVTGFGPRKVCSCGRLTGARIVSCFDTVSFLVRICLAFMYCFLKFLFLRFVFNLLHVVEFLVLYFYCVQTPIFLRFPRISHVGSSRTAVNRCLTLRLPSVLLQQ